MESYCQISYSTSMKNSLLNTNPYLKDAATRNKAMTRNVVSSSAIEGINVKRDTSSGRFISNTKDERTSIKEVKTSR